MVKKVITELDSFKATHSVVAWKNCEPELSCLLFDLVKMCLEDSCFLDSWGVTSMVPVLKNVEDRSVTKSYFSVSLLSTFSEILDKFLKTY